MPHQRMVDWYRSKGRDPLLSESIEALCLYYIAEGQDQGVRGDIAFCQACHETGWFGYGGQVQWTQNNYAGIGATNPETGQPIPTGHTFTSMREGVRAHIQHLFAYASTGELAYPLVDPRFHLVQRGVAPRWVDLNGRWAVPGTTYGQSILAKYTEMRG